tara:strand:+ start:963 stop:1259 length:297 start_codon:yes stop_codon:yes gene_type:complete
MFVLRPRELITKYEITVKITAEENVPPRRAELMSLAEPPFLVESARNFTMNIPINEQIIPREAKPRGKNISEDLGPRFSNKPTLMVEAIAMDAIIDPQ